MLNRTLLIFAVLCVAILVGCSKTETTENSNTPVGSSDKPTTTATTTTTTTTASTGEKIGVPECDDFIAKYEACTNKVPEIARGTYKSILDQWRAEWKKLADDPSTRAMLAAACKDAAARQAAAPNPYGCTW